MATMPTEQLKASVGADNIQHLTKLVEQLENAKETVKRLEIEVKAAKANREKLEKTDIPEFCFELGLSSAGLPNGKSVKIDPFYYARLPEVDTDTPEANGKRESALIWLRENGHSGIIKENIIIQPGIDNASLILEFLKTIHANYQEKSGVHWKTLESWFKEMIVNNQDIPKELFNGFVGRIAKVK